MIVTEKEFIDNIIEEALLLKKCITIVCIGTDKCIGDSLGPVVGTLCKEAGFKNIVVRGHFDDLFHAKNLENKFEGMDNELVIGIDASISYKKPIGSICYKLNTPIEPGKGVGKKLAQIGNHAITAVASNSALHLFNGDVRLGDVYKMAKDIVRTIKEINNGLSLAMCKDIENEKLYI